MKLREYKNGDVLPFTFEVTDPSGNSFIQNPNAPAIDPTLKVEHFDRSVEDYVTMGYNGEEAAASMDKIEDDQPIEKAAAENTHSGKVQESSKSVKQTREQQDVMLYKLASYKKDSGKVVRKGIDFSDGSTFDAQVGEEEFDPKKEITEFETNCEGCHRPGACKMCVATIPFFSEIIIMAFSCDHCGWRSSEIKQGGGIPEKATKIVFTALGPEDLNRDVFKSDTVEVKLPDCGIELEPGTQGSMYTTVEGLFAQIIEHLDKTNPFGKGDSVDSKAF